MIDCSSFAYAVMGCVMVAGVALLIGGAVGSEAYATSISRFAAIVLICMAIVSFLCAVAIGYVGIRAEIHGQCQTTPARQE
jgi:lysylphosphatidylglycerol synthetase-like protein (DUF2156 family)